jgi:Zn-dependent M16 (insulinase) family peptidase
LNAGSHNVNKEEKPEVKMEIIHGFERMLDQDIPEIKTRAELFRHVKTGAELLSLQNEDENKVFGITFRTPPKDSTGVPHILEHAVLCGSRKYPVKEPFVELLKGSLHTFLNAMTYPDKTCYPVASQNEQDFYNLIDVYLDAVFYPKITRLIFQQEGWHYELDEKTRTLIYKGVVFNEMKGVYSSPESLLAEYSQQSLFPDNTYGFDSGGNPKEIPNLTYDQFFDFHQKYYHPSNARIYFYGDDPPTQRLKLVNGYLKDFEAIEIDSTVPLHPPIDQPRRFVRSFAAGKDEERGPKGMMTVNWLFKETTGREMNMAAHILDYVLLGMAGSPLRKALIDSNLGEDLAGGGLGELRQLVFSTGLKGIATKSADQIESLILKTLADLSRSGIDPKTVEAAVNTTEFALRENNTGNFPRGLALMLRALNTWLYEEDPLALIAFEAPLEAVKSRLASNRTFFEEMIVHLFLKNAHRTTLILKPDPDLEKKMEMNERKKLNKKHKTMSPAELEDIRATMDGLKQLHETPDPPEALANIPTLKIADLDKQNRPIPLTVSEQNGTQIFYHDLFTNRICYFDLGLDLHVLPEKYLPYIQLFGRALLEMGTEKEDYVSLTQRISRKTGGIRPTIFNSSVKGKEAGAVWLFLRGKAMASLSGELLDILRDVLLSVRLNNRQRFRQIVLEAKARQERTLVPSGHQIVNLRLRAHFSEADWADEQMKGLSYYFFLRDLADKIDEDWPAVLTDLETIRKALINRNSMLFNGTMEEADWSSFRPLAHEFLDALPASPPIVTDWDPKPPTDFEGMTIPSQVNYVGKGVNLYSLGYGLHGSVQVITRYLRNVWLWEKIRLQGGAYGAFCHFDRLSGTLSFVSYRDPNLVKTVENFDRSADFLRDLELNEDERMKSIIGTIGDIDQYRLPDAKGYVSVARHLSGETDEDRQLIRDEVLATSPSDFRGFVEFLEAFKAKGLVKVLGSQSAIQEALNDRPGWLEVTKVL